MADALAARRPRAAQAAVPVCSGDNHLTAQQLLRLVAGVPVAERTRLSTLTTGKCLHGEHLIEADLRQLTLDDCNLSGAVLGLADLSHCSLRRANLSGARLNRASLVDANLAGANLSDALLEQADLSGANLLGANLRRANLDKARLSYTLVRADALGKRVLQDLDDHFGEARDIYLHLKTNFQDIGVYDSASWAYVRERVMERKTYGPAVARAYYGDEEQYGQAGAWGRLRFHIKYTLKWLWALVQEGIWGYGKMPLRVLGLALANIFVFAFIYYLGDGLVAVEAGRTLVFFDYLNFSLAAFTTSQLPDVIPATRMAQALASIEAMSGVAALALFTAGLVQQMGGR